MDRRHTAGHAAARCAAGGAGPGAPRRGMSGLLARWESHLASERRLSPHTVRAYVRAAERLLEETDATDWQAVAKLEAPALRAQLARRRADGLCLGCRAKSDCTLCRP